MFCFMYCFLYFREDSNSVNDMVCICFSNAFHSFSHAWELTFGSVLTVQGALRCLSLFAGDIDEQQIPVVSYVDKRN